MALAEDALALFAVSACLPCAQGVGQEKALYLCSLRACFCLTIYAQAGRDLRICRVSLYLSMLFFRCTRMDLILPPWLHIPYFFSLYAVRRETRLDPSLQGVAPS